MQYFLRMGLMVGFLAGVLGGALAVQAQDNFPVSDNWRGGLPPSGEMAFVLQRKGNNKPVGFQHFKFTDTDDGRLIVDIYSRIDIYLGPFRVFKYRHYNKEIWRDGRLLSLSSKTNNNGKNEFVALYEQDGKMLVRGNRYVGEVSPDIIPTSYFNPNFLRQSQVLSTQDGRVFPIGFTHIGRESVATYQGAVAAERFRVDGKLKIDIWYTPQGRWVRTEFKRGRITVEMVPANPTTHRRPRTQN